MPRQRWPPVHSEDWISECSKAKRLLESKYIHPHAAPPDSTSASPSCPSAGSSQPREDSEARCKTVRRDPDERGEEEGKKSIRRKLLSTPPREGTRSKSLAGGEGQGVELPLSCGAGDSAAGAHAGAFKGKEVRTRSLRREEFDLVVKCRVIITPDQP